MHEEVGVLIICISITLLIKPISQTVGVTKYLTECSDNMFVFGSIAYMSLWLWITLKIIERL